MLLPLTNLNGDYASDAWLHKLVVSHLPGANINYQTGHAIFEGNTWSSLDIADQDKANGSVLLSGLHKFQIILVDWGSSTGHKCYWEDI